MSIVIQIVALASGWNDGTGDSYIKDYTPDMDAEGRGHLSVTRELDRAKHFANHVEAMEFWRQQSKRNPYRPDGKPNRPLTAYTVVFLSGENAEPESRKWRA